MPDLNALAAIMARLRDPGGGCPWDLDQTFATIAPYTIEEAYEVADACERGDLPELKDELGDLLLQVVFHAQMASEQGAFTLDDVVAGICDKMIRRHPHVFSDDEDRTDAAKVKDAWESLKAAERAQARNAGALSGVARALPALMRAEKLQKRAARTGFDWPDASGARAKIAEELAEIEAAPPAEIEGEVGDLLFAAVNYARKLKVDPEQALRAANAKFERRFAAMEASAGEAFAGLSLDQKEALWIEAKQAE